MRTGNAEKLQGLFSARSASASMCLMIAEHSERNPTLLAPLMWDFWGNFSTEVKA
jgi:hypothetical protein